MLSDHRILCRPLLILLSIFPSIRGFSSDLALCIRWPQYWSFSFSIDPSNEYSELISFRIDWFGLLGVQETLKNLLQHHNSKCINSLALSVLYGSPTLTSVHDYWKKKISLTMWAFVSKMMSLFFNTLSRFVIAFLPRTSVYREPEPNMHSTGLSRQDAKWLQPLHTHKPCHSSRLGRPRPLSADSKQKLHLCHQLWLGCVSWTNNCHQMNMG